VEEPRFLKATEIKIGDVVGLWNGSSISPATVVEDMGNIGWGEHRMYRVRVASSSYPDDALDFDAPLESIVALPSPGKKRGGSRRRIPTGQPV
jgi:hypothetical protein